MRHSRSDLIAKRKSGGGAAFELLSVKWYEPMEGVPAMLSSVKM